MYALQRKKKKGLKSRSLQTLHHASVKNISCLQIFILHTRVFFSRQRTMSGLHVKRLTTGKKLMMIRIQLDVLARNFFLEAHKLRFIFNVVLKVPKRAQLGDFVMDSMLVSILA